MAQIAAVSVGVVDDQPMLDLCYTEDFEKAFIAEAAAEGLDGLKGHRSVGGVRASIYNAFPEEGVDALIAFMERFKAANS